MGKRLVFIDFSRGLAILYMIILHAFLYRVVNQYKPLFEEIMTTSPIIVRIIATPFVFFSLWGSFFCVLSGIVFVFRTQQDYLSRKDFRAGRYFLQRGISGFLLIIIHYIWLSFLSPKSTEHPGEATYSLLTGTLEQWKFSSLNIMHYSTTGMLESIGVIIIFLSLLGYFVYQRKEKQKSRFYGCFGIALLVTIAVSVFLDIWIENPNQFFNNLYDNNQLFLLIFLLKLTHNRFSLFPLIVFGFCGAFIGYNLNKDGFERSAFLILFLVGISCIVAYIIILFLGFDMMAGYTSTYVPLPLHLLNLGSQILFIAIFYLIFKNYQNKGQDRNPGIVRFFQMFSSTSLTIYIFESFASIILFRILQNLYFKPISEEFFIWTGFLLLTSFIWYVILYFWRKIDYRYSVEWFLRKMRERIQF